MTRTSRIGFALAASLAAGLLLVVVINATGATGPDAGPVQGNAANQIAAFSTPRSASDGLPAFVAEFSAQPAPSGTPDALYEGQWLTAQSRRLVSDLSGDAIYAVPTDRSRVCFEITLPASASQSANGGGGCIRDFDGSRPIGFSIYDPDEVDGGHPPIVGGVVPDGVIAVNVSVDGLSHRIPVIRNAFLYTLDSAGSYPDALTVVQASGATQRITIADSQPRTPAPSSG